MTSSRKPKQTNLVEVEEVVEVHVEEADEAQVAEVVGQWVVEDDLEDVEAEEIMIVSIQIELLNGEIALY